MLLSSSLIFVKTRLYECKWSHNQHFLENFWLILFHVTPRCCDTLNSTEIKFLPEMWLMGYVQNVPANDSNNNERSSLFDFTFSDETPTWSHYDASLYSPLAEKIPANARKFMLPEGRTALATLIGGEVGTCRNIRERTRRNLQNKVKQVDLPLLKTPTNREVFYFENKYRKPLVIGGCLMRMF